MIIKNGFLKFCFYFLKVLEGVCLWWESTMSFLFVNPVVLAGYLYWLCAQYMLFLTDCRIEVIIGIVFKLSLSKSSISSGLAPTV